MQQRWGPFEGRVTGYWNDVHDLIANVTLTGRLPDCPVGTTCRQRQNLDLARIRGIEAELDLRIAGDWRFLLSCLFVDARVVNATQQPALEGKRLLGGYFVMDAIISRAITRNVALYAAAENIFDTVITTGRTTDAVISIGQPFMFRGGVRLRF